MISKPRKEMGGEAKEGGPPTGSGHIHPTPISQISPLLNLHQAVTDCPDSAEQGWEHKSPRTLPLYRQDPPNMTDGNTGTQRRDLLRVTQRTGETEF